MVDVLPGAGAWSAEGTNGHGVLVCHGFTGNPSSMRGLAEAFHGAGFTVELPRWPGHGTTLDDMLTTTWADYSAAAEAAYADLAARVDKVVLAGLSMGGTIVAWLAARHPEVAAAVFVNPAVEPTAQSFRDAMAQTLEGGMEVIPGIGSDVAKEGVVESAYAGTPIRPLISMFDAVAGISADLPRITCPVLLFTSRQDHVVPPSNSDHLAERVTGPVERVFLDRSYHVATIDHDADEIVRRSLEFAAEHV